MTDPSNLSTNGLALKFTALTVPVAYTPYIQPITRTHVLFKCYFPPIMHFCLSTLAKFKLSMSSFTEGRGTMID